MSRARNALIKKITVDFFRWATSDPGSIVAVVAESNRSAATAAASMADPKNPRMASAYPLSWNFQPWTGSGSCPGTCSVLRKSGAVIHYQINAAIIIAATISGTKCPSHIFVLAVFWKPTPGLFLLSRCRAWAPRSAAETASYTSRGAIVCLLQNRFLGRYFARWKFVLALHQPKLSKFIKKSQENNKKIESLNLFNPSFWGRISLLAAPSLATSRKRERERERPLVVNSHLGAAGFLLFLPLMFLMQKNMLIWIELMERLERGAIYGIYHTFNEFHLILHVLRYQIWVVRVLLQAVNLRWKNLVVSGKSRISNIIKKKRNENNQKETKRSETKRNETKIIKKKTKNLCIDEFAAAVDCQKYNSNNQERDPGKVVDRILSFMWKLCCA